MLAIETRGLSVHFGEVPGIVDLDLEVRSGEVFGFVGPNGAGKTTTIRLLLDLLRPDRGEVRILGEDVRAGGGALRARIGYLPGDLRLPPSLSGQQALELFGRLRPRPTPLRDEVLDRLGFRREALRRKVKTYSTGMRQALGITAALQHDPELAILDEPTTGLDPVVRDAFLELVRDRARAGRSVLLSSHVLDEVDRSADRVGYVARSRLRLVESVEEQRRRRPRSVRLRYRDPDGREREEQYTSAADPAELLAGIDREGLVDVEVRAASLDEVFRQVVFDDAGEGAR